MSSTQQRNMGTRTMWQFVVFFFFTSAAVQLCCEAQLRDSDGNIFNGLNFGLFALEEDTSSGGENVDISIPDVPAVDAVLDDVNLLLRNNLVAAAGNAQTPAPVQRIKTSMNSGLRR